MTLRALLAALLVFVGTPWIVRAEQPIRVEIIEYGVYTAETVTPALGIGPTIVKSEGVTNICHVATTREVPKKDGLRFGFRYRITGPVAGVTVDLKQSARWPDHSHPPESLNSYVTYGEATKRRVGEESYFLWLNQKMMPGIWTMRLSIADEMLAEMSFRILDDIKLDVSDSSNCFQVSSVEKILKDRVL